MKRFLIFCFAVIFVGSIQAQQDSSRYIDIDEGYNPNEMETFRNDKQHHGGVFAFDVHYGQIEKENAIFSQFKAAYIMNRSLEVGLAGVGFYSDLQDGDFFDGDASLIGGYGGLHIAPVIMPLKRVHLAFPILLGAGAVGYDDELWGSPGDLRWDDDWDEIFVAQFGANVVFNITRNFQLELGARYLKTTDIELDRINDLDLDGWTGGFGFRFGWF